MKSLLDASVETTTLDIIRNVVEADPRVKGIRSIIARNSGSVIFINLVITLNLKGLKEAHEASEEIAASVRKAVTRRKGANSLRTWYQGIYFGSHTPIGIPDGRISDHFGSAPYIALVKLKRTSHQVLQHDILPNPYSTDEKAKGIHLSQLLIQKGVDVIYTRESLEGKGPAILIERANVNVEIIDHKYLSSFLKNIVPLQNKDLANP